MHISALLLVTVALPALCQYAGQPIAQPAIQQQQFPVAGQQQIPVAGQLAQQQNVPTVQQQQMNLQIMGGATNGQVFTGQVSQVLTSAAPVLTTNGVCINNHVLFPNSMLQTWGMPWGMSAQQVGQIVIQVSALPIQSNILTGCRQICLTHRIPMHALVRISHSCRSHILQQGVTFVNRQHLALWNTAANVFVQRVVVLQQPRLQQQQQVVIVQQPPRPIIVQQQQVLVRQVVLQQPVAVRVQRVCSRFGITQAHAVWMGQFIMSNMGSWGCCGLVGGNAIRVTKRDNAPASMEEVANDAGMQDDMATVMELMMGNATMLSKASFAEAQGFVKDTATAMEMSPTTITNMCGTAVAAMLQSNMTEGDNLNAMTNCATAKDATFVDPAELSTADAQVAVTTTAGVMMPKVTSASGDGMSMSATTSATVIPMMSEVMNGEGIMSSTPKSEMMAKSSGLIEPTSTNLAMMAKPTAGAKPIGGNATIVTTVMKSGAAVTFAIASAASIFLAYIAI
ncbi:hypothetical protein BC830DRAFT_1082546 [Chytriomyces sp. MP71]|nr:hypothetical protein BC830DRAFT_1082546 [Chytriomyces sp. MP71]